MKVFKDIYRLFTEQKQYPLWFYTRSWRDSTGKLHIVDERQPKLCLCGKPVQSHLRPLSEAAESKNICSSCNSAFLTALGKEVDARLRFFRLDPRNRLDK